MSIQFTFRSRWSIFEFHVPIIVYIYSYTGTKYCEQSGGDSWLRNLHFEQRSCWRTAAAKKHSYLFSLLWIQVYKGNNAVSAKDYTQTFLLSSPEMGGRLGRGGCRGDSRVWNLQRQGSLAFSRHVHFQSSPYDFWKISQKENSVRDILSAFKTCALVLPNSGHQLHRFKRCFAFFRMDYTVSVRSCTPEQNIFHH